MRRQRRVYATGAGLLALLGVLGVGATASAHGGHEHETSKARTPRIGGLGYMQLGTFVGAIGDLGPALSQPLALGDGAKGPGFGYTIGGGGRALVASRLSLGGKGFGLFTPRFGGPRGSARVSGGGGGFELGVAAVNRDQWLFIPFVGVGGYGMGLEVANESLTPMVIAEDEPIPSGGTRDYGGGSAYIEVGAATHRLLFFGGTGGFAVGFDFGAMFSVASSGWSSDRREHPGLKEARLTGGYLRLTIGGGGYTYR